VNVPSYATLSRIKRGLLISPLAIALILANTPSVNAASPSTVVAGLTQEVQSFDPAQNLSGPINAPLHSLVYESLVSLDTSGKIVGVLAASYRLSSDGLTYTFNMRSNIKFHNGATLTAADVVYSFKRAMIGAPQVAQRFVPIKSITATNPRTVVIEMKAPNTAFIYTLADPTLVGTAIVPNGYTSAEIAKNPVGTGPFKFVSFSPGSDLILQKSDSYWSVSTPKFTTLRYHFIPQEASMVSAYIAGQVDMMTLSSIPNVQMLKNSKSKVSLSSIPSGGFWLNISRIGATRPNVVAQAIALAIDRDKINTVVFAGTAIPGTTANPALKYGVPIKQLPNYTRDVAKAKSLLASAGFPTGITLNFIYPNRAPFTATLFEVIKSSLAEAGITVNIQPLEPAVWLPRFINGNYDISMTDQAWYSNPVRYVIPRTGWQAPPSEILPELTALLASLDAASNATRPALFQEIQILEAKNAYPYLGLVWTQSYLAFNPTKIKVTQTSDRLTGSLKKLFLSVSVK
jgi:peptide/nickel transport system substrate-binding protein